jgi:hypothetical protein
MGQNRQKLVLGPISYLQETSSANTHGWSLGPWSPAPALFK